MPATRKPRLTHLSPAGAAHMVDVSSKPPLVRTAVAEGHIALERSTLTLLRRNGLPKGDVLAVARIAGIQAAKETARLIPLCHPLPIDAVSVDFSFRADGISIAATVRTTASTGVEMEALTAVSVAALTLYDMCKAVDKIMCISGIRLRTKTKEGPRDGPGQPA
jgi:cyclic pyranopterin phosphate synthase